MILLQHGVIWWQLEKMVNWKTSLVYYLTLWFATQYLAFVLEIFDESLTTWLLFSSVQLLVGDLSPSWMDRSPALGGQESILQIRTASGSWLLPHSIASLCSLMSSRLRAMMWALELLWVHTGWGCSVLSLCHTALVSLHCQYCSSQILVFYFKSKLNVPLYSPWSDSLFRFASMTMWRYAVDCQLIQNYTGSSVGQRNQKL